MENNVTMEPDNHDKFSSGFGRRNVCVRRDVHNHALVKHFSEVIRWYQKSKPVVM